MKRYKLFVLPVLAIVGAGLLGGCKKFPDPGLVIEEYQPDTTVRVSKGDRKVLLITIDGLRADILSQLKPASFENILKNAKYSFSAVTNLPVNNTGSWGSMLTGNFDTRLWDSTFYAVPVDTTNTIPVPLNITALRYTHGEDIGKRIVAVADWPNLVNTLMNDADKKLVTTGDEATKAAVEQVLRTDSADLIVARFSDVQKAGAQYGFADTDGYKAAIQKVDSYVGAVMNALRSKPDYASEKWLTLITTTQVSDTLLTTENWANSPLQIPSFVIAHYPGFTPQDITKINPAIIARTEDITALILYWLRVSKPTSVVNGFSWIDRFELEFLTK